MEKTNVVVCPKCGSRDYTASKKGFTFGCSDFLITILTGGIWLLIRLIGNHKIKITCLNCGYHRRPKK